jgi:predicted P-loop ATPase
MTPQQEIVKAYFERNMRVVFWPDVGTQKGPTEKEWTRKQRTFEEYDDTKRVGLITGAEISPGKFLIDIDIDWQQGVHLALAHLPHTNFVFGRKSKHVSHAFYTLPEGMPSLIFKDPVFKDMLLELRGTREDGQLGFQTMAPPSIWANAEGKREPLEFRGKVSLVDLSPGHVDTVADMRRCVTLAATSMLLGRHLGHHGFGHDARLAWAGFLLRLGVAPDDLVKMGVALSKYCNNTEVSDVQRVVDSTMASLKSTTKKVAGGPALAKIIGGNGTKVVAAIRKWMGEDDDFIRGADNSIVRDNQENIKRALSLMQIELSYNSFAEKVLIRDLDGVEETQKDKVRALLLTDKIMIAAWLKLDRQFHFRPTKEFFNDVVRDLAHENTFHPVRDYLDALIWDKVPRIDTWLKVYGGAIDPEEESEKEDANYLEAVSALPLIAAVRRIREPGCKYDEMLVLESEQGQAKSSALRALCPDDEWFSDDLPLNVDAKQIIERTLGKWIIEASDLVGGRKADRDHLKSMMSRQVDGPARLAYERNPIERRRQFVIVGTTNSAAYLADMTGARRFWPVTVTKFDLEALKKDRDQLWAEAAYRESKNESIRLSEGLWKSAFEQQESRRELDAWEETIQTFLEGLEVTEAGRQQTSVESVWECLAIEVARRDRMGGKRISEIMQRFGFTRRTIREEGKALNGYVKEKTKLILLKKEDEDDGDVGF